MEEEESGSSVGGPVWRGQEGRGRRAAGAGSPPGTVLDTAGANCDAQRGGGESE